MDLPRNKLTVITGLSGSGKSSLAFDTLYAEGQRRYVESLSAYARQFLSIMEKPDVDSIEGRKVEAASQKRWQAIRDQDPAAYNTLVQDAEFHRTGPDAKRRDYTAVMFETLNDPKKKLDAVTVSDQVIVVLGGETAVETGRAVGTKKDLNEPVWDVLYTATWVRKDGRWWVVNEHQIPAR